MSLQYRFFSISAKDSREAEAEINRFLETVRIVNIHREFVSQGENSYWCLAVEFLTDKTGNAFNRKGKNRPRVDYREILSSEDFVVFAKLREWRKERSNKEGTPVYTVFTNEQLAAIAQNRITAKADLQAIDGIGDARVKKYGDSVIRIMQEFQVKEREADK
jgi:superfamily II DNA helicase RecQ